MNNILTFDCHRSHFEISDKVIVIRFYHNGDWVRRDYKHSIKDINELFKMINDIKLKLSHTNDTHEFVALMFDLIDKYGLK